MYARRTRADPSTLGIHYITRAYVVSLQTLIFRVLPIYKHHWQKISSTLSVRCVR